ncbi:efflux RND transporter periplasmic adaptor subunit [Massilia sp. W12]|uniref:efflux RND transporter periplasmic adaptor subunit n=1 Tax=Massilia sp. W12 TaxID=3126507 RepID=UPI0030D50FA5
MAVLHIAGKAEPSLANRLRAAAQLAEPMLRHWRKAEQSLPGHVWQLCSDGIYKLSRPGSHKLKISTAAAVLLISLLCFVPVQDRVAANSVIEGKTRQTLSAPFDGFIAEVWARPGMTVKKGQKLAQFDRRDLLLEQAKLQSQYEQAASKLRTANAEHDAAASMAAGAELRKSQAELDEVQARLERSTILAPMDGLIVSGDWSHQIGVKIDTGRQLFEVDSSEKFRVILHVPEREIERVRNGQTGYVRLTGRPDAAYPFVVTNVTPVADVQNGENGFRVEADWQGASPLIKPGMQGVGKIETGQTNLLTVFMRDPLHWLRIKIWSWGW